MHDVRSRFWYSICGRPSVLMLAVVLSLQAAATARMPGIVSDEEWAETLEFLRNQTKAAQPEGANAWPRLEQVGETLQALGREHLDADFASIYDPEYLWFEDAEFDDRIRRNTHHALEEAMGSGLHTIVLESANQRIVFPFEGDEAHPLNFIRQLRHVREITSFMHAVGNRRLHDGDAQGWFDTVDAVLAMARSTATHPGLLPTLVAIAATDRAREQVQLAIEAGPMPQGVLEQLAEALGHHTTVPISNLIASDRLLTRAMLRQYFDEQGNVKAEVRSEGDDLNHNLRHLYGMIGGSADCLGHFRFPTFETVEAWLTHITQQIDHLAEVPVTAMPALEPFTDEPECFAFAELIQSIGSAHRQAIIVVRRHETLQRGAQIAIALERFRLATGTYPAALEELKPALLTEVPHDPYTGQGFGYRVISGDDDAEPVGYVLYSFGGNGIDNGGTGCALDSSGQSGWRVGNEEPCDVILFEQASP